MLETTGHRRAAILAWRSWTMGALAPTFATRTATRTATISLNLVLQVTVLLMLTGLVIWTLLFSSYPAIHDPVHALRHALYLIPCH